MLSLAECRKILGKKYEHYTDKQIERIREWLHQIAELQIKGLTKKSNS